MRKKHADLMAEHDYGVVSEVLEHVLDELEILDRRLKALEPDDDEKKPAKADAHAEHKR
jgi:hypothetical protein